MGDQATRLRAAYLLVLLHLAYVVSFLDRQIVNLLVEPLRKDLHLSDSQIGLTQSVSFGIFYILATLPLGRLVDTVSRRAVVVAGMLTWSAATFGAGLSRSYVQFFAARVAVAMGEASLSPAAYSLITDSVPRRVLGRALSFYGMGSIIGSGVSLIFGGILIGWLTTHVGLRLPIIGQVAVWQATFILISPPGVLLAIIILLTTGEPARLPQSVGVPLKTALAYLWARRRIYGGVMFGFALMSLNSYAADAWLPAHFQRSQGIEPREYGVAVGAITLPAALLGPLLGGWLSDRLYCRGEVDGALRIAVVVALMMIVPCALTPLLPFKFAIASLGLSALGMGMTIGLPPAGLQLVTPGGLRGQVGALFLFIVNIVGFGIGPSLVELVSNLFGPGALRAMLSVLPVVTLSTAALLLRRVRGPYCREVAALAADVN